MDSQSQSEHISISQNNDHISTLPTTSQIPVVQQQDDNSSVQPPSQLSDEELAKLKEDQLELEYKRELEQHLRERLEEENKYKIVNVRKEQSEKINCLAVDGFETASYAFDILLHEFLPRLNSILICPYIYNSVHDEEYNWRHQKEYVIDSYKIKLLTNFTEEKGRLIIQDTDPFCQHPIEQVCKIANLNQCEYLFLGYNGMKTGNFKPANIKKGIDYLLRNSTMPTVIFKDKNLRGVKNKGYKWLILMDRANSDCFKVFDFFFPLMDIERDFIYGYTLLPKYVSFDDIKKEFDEKMKEIGISEDQVMYESVKYVARPSELVKVFVNRNDENYFDFVIFYNNPDKYKIEKENSESFKYIEKLKSNICFVNGVYIERMRVKEEEKKTKELEENLKQKE